MRERLEGLTHSSDDPHLEEESLYFNYASMLMKEEPEKALKYFLMATELNPERDASWFSIALIQETKNHIEAALEAYTKAIAVSHVPDVAIAAYNNKIGLLLNAHRLEDAARVADAAVNAFPDSPTTWISMGVVLRENGSLDWARACFESALARGANNDAPLIVALNNLGSLFVREGKLSEAIGMYKRAVKAVPEDLSSVKGLASALADAGSQDEAAILWKHAQTLDPTDKQTQFQLDMLEGALSSESIADLFDWYATSGYDEHMVETLNYRGPQLLWEAFSNVSSLSKQQLSDLRIVELGVGSNPNLTLTVELGVGSGLCAKHFRKEGLGGDIIGCDLSPVMVEKAARAEIGTELVYRNVVVSDAVNFLESNGGGEADLLLAADVLCYIGDLERLFRAARSTLNNTGIFLFTLEEMEGAATFELKSSGRFAHSLAYIKDIAACTGFKLCLMNRATVRFDGAVPVPTIILCLSRC